MTQAAALPPVPIVSEPIVRFLRATPGTRPPQRADRAAAGTLPARAAQYCDAVTQASAFGYYLFAPMELSLVWDGTEIFWTFPGLDSWLPLAAAQYPGFAALFDSTAPAELQGCSPPFLTALPEPGVIQIWTGLFARTARNWSLLVRPVVNFPLTGGYVPYEGIVETDRWFGPLFTNLRLTRTDTPIRLRADVPLVQAQPIPNHVYTDATLQGMAQTDGLAAFTAKDWDDYRTTIAEPNTRPDRPAGAYATTARRARRCPVG